jgi:putative tricarboxylic transport membrane protein
MLLLMSPWGTQAAPFPSKPIEVVTHNAPGAVMDVMSRLVSDIMRQEKILDQPLVVVNKQGTGGAAAMAYVLRGKGDPHMLMPMPSAIILGTPLLQKLPYNYKSFTPIANLVIDGNVLAVRTESPFKTIHDLIAEARKRPKSLTMSMTSYTAPQVMMSREIMRKQGVQWNLVNFKSNPEALMAALGGHVDFTFSGPWSMLDHVRAGKLRILLSGTAKRYSHPLLKDVPSIEELKLGDAVVSYRGVFAAPEIPASAVKTLEAALKKAYETERFKKYIDEEVMQPGWMASGEYAKFLDVESVNVKERLIEAGELK